MTVNSVTGELTIQSIRTEDAGNYTCVANSKAGKLEASAYITVYTKPLMEDIGNVTVVEGVVRVKFLCTATGNPLPKLEWRRNENNEPISSSEKIEVKVRKSEEKEKIESTLNILNSAPSDAGLYECVATNIAGSCSKSAKLIVEFPPTFVSQEMDQHWSWDQRPVKLPCEGSKSFLITHGGKDVFCFSN